MKIEGVCHVSKPSGSHWAANSKAAGSDMARRYGTRMDVVHVKATLAIALSSRRHFRHLPKPTPLCGSLALAVPSDRRGRCALQLGAGSGREAPTTSHQTPAANLFNEADRRALMDGPAEMARHPLT